MISVFLFLMMVDGETMTFSPENQYEPIQRQEVAQLADGTLAILNHKEKVVSLYDANGALKSTFGKSGQGPGEFDFPTGLFAVGQKIYVNDLGKQAIMHFGADGSFEQQIAYPRRWLSMIKVENGWLGAMTRTFRPDQQIEVFWYNEEMGEETRIAAWDAQNGGGGMRIEAGGSGKPTVPYNPISDRASFVGNAGARYAYLYPAGSYTIHVIDSQEKKVAATIKQDNEKIAFNEEYGQARFDEFVKLEPNKRMANRVSFKANFPEFFPAVREVFTTSEGHLAVRRWTGNPEKQDHVDVFNAQGKPVKLGYDAVHARRVLAQTGNAAWLNMWDAEEEIPSLQLVPISKLNKVAAATSYNTAAEAPRLMVRMD